MHYTELFTKEQLENALQEKLVNVQKHPVHDLFIYNYSQNAQFQWVWNNVTLNCRGLILDKDGNTIARPLPKFFSYEQLECKLPDGIFEVQEKMDGSLGIIFNYKGETIIATRGSFVSDQAKKAYSLLPKDFVPAKRLTYLVEIIYKENRIVVDYKGWEGLVLLTILDENGKEINPYTNQFKRPRVYSYQTVGEMLAHDEEIEGFVLKYEDGTRVKIKLEEYKRLHRLLTGFSEKNVWECLMNNSLDKVIEEIPDEMFDFVKQTRENIERNFLEIENTAKEFFKDLGDRKSNALYYQKFKYPSILFHMLDKKDYKSIIWKLVMPKVTKVFKTTNDLTLVPDE